MMETGRRAIAEASRAAEAPTPARPRDRSLPFIGVGVAVIAIGAVIAVVLLANRAPVTYSPDSPQAALQGYLQAFERGDYATSYTYFSEEVRATTSEAEYRTLIQQYGIYDSNPSSRILFDRTTGSGDRVVLHLIVEQSSGGGPFGGGDVYRSSRQIAMVREAAGWRINQALVWVDPGPFPGLVKG
jgi:hypothetical protein